MIPQSIVDGVGAALCLLTAIAFFGIHVVTSPKRKAWIVLPEYVRRGLWASGALFMIRGFSLTSSDGVAGNEHIPPLGFLTLMAITWTVCALAVWVVRRHFPEGLWDRFAWAEHQVHTDPQNVVPLVMTKKEVVETAQAQGIEVAEPRG